MHANTDELGLGNRLLTALSQRDAATLLPHLRQVELQRGEALHRPGEKIEQVYFLHSGVVSLLAILEGGATVETASIGNEGAIGTIEGFGSLSAFTHALVQVPGSASRIAGPTFRRIVAESEELREIINHYHMSVMAHVQQTSACNAHHDLTSRLCRILLLAADRCHGHPFLLTQEALAHMLGVRRPSVSAAARMLKASGAIGYRRGSIKVLNRRALEDTACECYRTIRRTIDMGFRGIAQSQRK